MSDDEAALEAFQIAMLEALDRGGLPALDDPAVADYRDYVASCQPHLVEATVKLIALWQRLAPEAEWPSTSSDRTGTADSRQTSAR